MKGCNSSMATAIADRPEILTSETEQAPSDLRLRYFCYAALVIVVVVFAAIRIRLRTAPLERDEGEYAYAGQLMLQGIPPYKEVYNMKLPGTYATYAVIMALFGQSASAIHRDVALVSAISVFLVFLIGRRLLEEIAGVVAAMVFALLSLSPSV